MAKNDSETKRANPKRTKTKGSPLSTVYLILLAPLIIIIFVLHGRASFNWNGEENSRGRNVWCNSIDRWIRNERHFWTALNYIHHNPVKHGLVNKLQDWPFSSASDYLKKVGVKKAQEVWCEFPIRNYENGWLDSRL